MYYVNGIRAGKPSFDSGPYDTELEASTAAGVYAYSLLVESYRLRFTKIRLVDWLHIMPETEANADIFHIADLWFSGQNKTEETDGHLERCVDKLIRGDYGEKAPLHRQMVYAHYTCRERVMTRSQLDVLVRYTHLVLTMNGEPGLSIAVRSDALTKSAAPRVP